MKNRIGIAIIALLSVFTSCFFIVGCTPPAGYITIDSGSAVMQPTFYVCDDPYFQKRLRIGSIEVLKVRRSSGKKKRWNWNSLLNDRQTVWELELAYSDTFIVALSQLLFRPTVSSLTYGEVPWGYEEKVKALPLEPEEFYIVLVTTAYHSRPAAPLRFIIPLNDTGFADRLEYSGGTYYTDDIFFQTRSYLSLY